MVSAFFKSSVAGKPRGYRESEYGFLFFYFLCSRHKTIVAIVVELRVRDEWIYHQHAFEVDRAREVVCALLTLHVGVRCFGAGGGDCDVCRWC